MAKIQLDGRTKKDLLRALSSIFDPLGFLAPIVFLAKFLLQEIWRLNVGWDDILEPQVTNRWNDWARSLSAIEGHVLGRQICPVRASIASIELHIFGDASENGFGAVAYLRFPFPGGAEVSFVMAKSRVAPMKFFSIPWMELCAAVLAVRLRAFIIKEMDVSIDDVLYWSDSTTVLGWIKSRTCRFNTYVGNRVGEILESSSLDQWNYVPSADNPADDASRGIAASNLSTDHRWFRGPGFLRLQSEHWPEPLPPDMIENDDPEIRVANWIVATKIRPDYLYKIIFDSSNIDYITRIVAKCFRFFSNCSLSKEKRKTGIIMNNYQAPKSSLVTGVR